MAAGAAFCAACGKPLSAGSAAGQPSAPVAAPTPWTPVGPGAPSPARGVAFMILVTLITCGFYMIRWYFAVLGELTRAGKSPTGNSPWLDFLLALLTCGLWGLFVDYRIAKTVAELQAAHGIVPPNDTTLVVLVLDIVGLGLIGSAVQQSEMNRLWTVGRWT